MKRKMEAVVKLGPVVGAIWVAAGSITVALSEVARVLGRTGQRLYAYDGGAAEVIGFSLIVVGAVAVVARVFGRVGQDVVDE